MADAGFVSVWEFDVRAERAAEFVAAYAPGGDWTRLFARAPGWLGTELLADPARPHRYVTIDRWVDRAAWQAFARRFASEYAELDARCAEWTREEVSHGELVAVTVAAPP